jgi:predicted transcriptional regulator
LGEIRREMPDVTFGAVSQQLKWLLKSGLVGQGRRNPEKYTLSLNGFGALV